LELNSTYNKKKNKNQIKEVMDNNKKTYIKKANTHVNRLIAVKSQDSSDCFIESKVVMHKCRGFKKQFEVYGEIPTGCMLMDFQYKLKKSSSNSSSSSSSNGYDLYYMSEPAEPIFNKVTLHLNYDQDLCEQANNAPSKVFYSIMSLCEPYEVVKRYIEERMKDAIIPFPSDTLLNWTEFQKKVRQYIQNNDRNKLAPIYASFGPFVKTFFSVPYRMFTRLDLISFFKYINRVFFEGSQVLFQETMIPQMSILKQKKVRRPTGAKKLTNADKAALKTIFNEQNEYSGYVSGGGGGGGDGDDEDGEYEEEEGVKEEKEEGNKKDKEGYEDDEEEYKPVLFKLKFTRAVSISNKQQDEEVDLESFFLNVNDQPNELIDDDDDDDDDDDKDSKLTTEDDQEGEEEENEEDDEIQKMVKARMKKLKDFDYNVELNLNSDYKNIYDTLEKKLQNAKEHAEDNPDEASKIEDLESQQKALRLEVEDKYLDRFYEAEEAKRKKETETWAIHNKYKHPIISNDKTECIFKFPRLLEMDKKWWIREWIVFYITERLDNNRDYYVYGDELLKAANTPDKRFRFELSASLVLLHLPDVIMMSKLCALMVLDIENSEWEQIDVTKVSRDYVVSLLTQLSDNSLMCRLCLMTPEAWRQEQLIGSTLNARRGRDVAGMAATPQVTDIVTIERDCYGEKIGEKTARPEGKQVEAYEHAMKKQTTIVCGDGGTGKSFLMEYITYGIMRQAAEMGTAGNQLFIFLSFKNDVMQTMRHTILKSAQNIPTQQSNGCIMKEWKNCIFMTLDMFGFKASTTDFWNKTIERLMKKNEGEDVDTRIDGISKRDMWTPEIAAIFIDEAGMMATHHLFKLLRSLPDEHTLPTRRLIFMGDHNQLPPIANGNPFKRMVHMMKDVTVELVKNHRTGVDELLLALNEIKNGDEAFMKRFGFGYGRKGQGQNESFSWIPIDGIRERTQYARAQKNYMNMIGEKMFKLLGELDPERKNYKDTIALVPYNDMRAYVGFVMSNYYFGHGLTVDQMHAFSTTRYRRRGEGLPVLSLGMRVVFLTNNKLDEDKENRFSRGQLGVVEQIIDSNKNHDTPNRINYRYLKGRGPLFRNNTAPNNDDMYYTTRTMIIHSYTDPSRKYHVYVNMRNPSSLFDVIDSGNAITVMRSQGQSLKNVILVLPYGHNLSTREMLYTGSSRAVYKLMLIGAYDQVSKMLSTTTNIGNSFLRFLLAKKENDDDDEDDDDEEDDDKEQNNNNKKAKLE
jgi:hypothetical protein